MLHKTLFTIDGTEAIFEGYTDGSHWNGWACPWFTKEVADKIARIVNKEHLSELDGEAMYYLQKTDTFHYEPFGDDMREEFKGKDIDGLHLYPIGNACWVWDDLREYQNKQTKMLMTYLREKYFWLDCEQLYDVYYGIAQEIDGYMSDEEVRIFADGFVAAYGRKSKWLTLAKIAPDLGAMAVHIKTRRIQTMTIKELLEMYDNWNGITKINDCNLNCIAKDTTWKIVDNDELTAKEVVSFGFCDNEFCIRINEWELVSE